MYLFVSDLVVPPPRPFSVKLPPVGQEDEDVARERERVKSGRAKGDILEVKELTKVRGLFGAAVFK